jgi:hypothetical protein
MPSDEGVFVRPSSHVDEPCTIGRATIVCGVTIGRHAFVKSP